MSESLILKSLNMAGNVVVHIKPEDLVKPTPCKDWDVKALLNHMVAEVAWVKPLLEGKTVADLNGTLDGDLLGEQPLRAWQGYADAATQAISSTNQDKIVHLSYADKTATAYLDEVGADVVVHTWDLARAIGETFVIDDATAEAVMNGMKDIMPMARQGGYLGAKLPIDNSASATKRLLAEFGRSADWSA